MRLGWVGLDEVEVDGVGGILGVVAGEVVGVTGGEGVHFIKVVDNHEFGGALSGGFVEFLVVKRTEAAGFMLARE